jgi:peptidoglycan hydrolase FlgJ
MSSLATVGQPIDLLSQSVTSYAPPRGVTRDAATIDRTAKAFEASFLTTMFNSMFDGLSTAPPFGGGEGEQAFRSFLSEAMAKQVVKHGGVGVAHSVRREMLKMQGLQDPAAPATSAPTVHKE